MAALLIYALLSGALWYTETQEQEPMLKIRILFPQNKIKWKNKQKTTKTFVQYCVYHSGHISKYEL